MADVGVGEDERVVADNGAFGLGAYAAVYDYMFADGDVIADMAVGEAPFPSEVLGLGTHDGALEHTAACPHARAAHHRGIGHDFAAGTYLHILVDECEGVYFNVVGNFCRGVDISEIGYHGSSLFRISKMYLYY